MLEIQITNSILLDNCWVCSSKEALEEHHVIPRAAFGTNGPTVTICASCHSLVHHQSFKPVHLRQYGKIADIQNAKLNYLSNAIALSMKSVKHIEKPQLKSVVCDQEHIKMLQVIKETKGFRNIDQVLLFAIEAAYREVSPLKH